MVQGGNLAIYIYRYLCSTVGAVRRALFSLSPVGTSSRDPRLLVGSGGPWSNERGGSITGIYWRYTLYTLQTVYKETSKVCSKPKTATYILCSKPKTATYILCSKPKTATSIFCSKPKTATYKLCSKPKTATLGCLYTTQTVKPLSDNDVKLQKSSISICNTTSTVATLNHKVQHQNCYTIK
jgi:hypothetical protein